MGEAQEIVALALTFVVHVVGAVLLVWAMIDREESSKGGGWRGWWPRDDRPDGGPPEPPPGPPGDRAPLPLADAAPSPVRLRERGARIADAHPRPDRRPSHAPEPDPAPRQPA